MKGKIFLIQHDVFDSQTLVAVGVSDRRLKKWIRKNTTSVKFDDDMKLHGAARTVQNGRFSMIRLRGLDGSNYDISILAHEAFHLAEFLFNRIGVSHDVEISGEVFAYHIQSTIKQVLDVLNNEETK